MNKKMMLLGLAVISAALFALPAVASAGSPQVDLKSYPITFSGTGGHSELRAGENPPVTCTTSHVHGEWTSATTGVLTVTFTGCKESIFGTQCNNTGVSGVIKTNTSVFHTTYLTSAKTTPGILVTPPTGGTFAEFKCPFVGSSVKVTGNGLLGHISEPKCGATSATATIGFTATGSTQTYRQVTGAGTIYSLQSSLNGGAPVAAAEVTSAKTTLAGGATATLTCV